MWSNKILVLGVGNILKGDDGVGPAVIDQLQLKKVEENNNGKADLIDVGTGLTPFLLDLFLFEGKPKAVIIIDSFLGEVEGDFTPKIGGIFEIDISSFKAESEIGSLESHKLPPSELLANLREQGVIIRILVCKVRNIPEEVEMGLSPPIKYAIPKICEEIDRIINDIN